MSNIEIDITAVGSSKSAWNKSVENFNADEHKEEIEFLGKNVPKDIIQRLIVEDKWLGKIDSLKDARSVPDTCPWSDSWELVLYCDSKGELVYANSNGVRLSRNCVKGIPVDIGYELIEQYENGDDDLDFLFSSRISGFDEFEFTVGICII